MFGLLFRLVKWHGFGDAASWRPKRQLENGNVVGGKNCCQGEKERDAEPVLPTQLLVKL